MAPNATTRASRGALEYEISSTSPQITNYMDYLTTLKADNPELATKPIHPKLTWTDPVQYWDFHVYYDERTRDEANALKQKLLDDFPEQAKEGSIIVKQLKVEEPIGPHYDLFWEVDVARVDVFAKVLSWFSLNHGTLSVLIHPQTGWDLLDHTKHALWLGEKKPVKTFIFPTHRIEVAEFGVPRLPQPDDKS